MSIEKKLVRNFSRVEPQKLGLGLLLGCFVILVIYFSISKPYAVHFPTANSRLAIDLAPPSPTVNGASSSPTVSTHSEGMESMNETERNPVCNGTERGSELCKKIDAVRIHGNWTTAPEAPPGREDANITVTSGIKNETQNISSILDDAISDSPVGIKNSSVTIIDLTQKEKDSHLRQLGTGTQEIKPERKPMCVLDQRSDLCEIDGDIRIHGQSSNVILVDQSQTGDPVMNESWQIRPYARKSDTTAMAHVREVHIKSLNGYNEAPQCTLNHSVPAIVFSNAGYSGNYFHDFTDVLVPLFLTSRQFNGEVQFLVANMHQWWIHKYLPILTKLSRYEVIDFDNDNRVHCFQRAIVGLRCNKELSIDPLRSLNGYSMVDFTKFMRSAYALPRDAPMRIGEIPGQKPRLLIISRSQTRKFTNINKITHMAKSLGYEVVIMEAETDIAKFSSVVNSCDVMMGVHGAGLTNLVFLPTRAVFIQIVPWGKLDWIARNFFQEPAKDMQLRYLEYTIDKEESTLIEQYPRDHPVFTDPSSVGKLGWNAVREVFLVKQNVKLNVRRFRAVLKKALSMLHQ